MIRGVVRHWNVAKHYGFIVGEDAVAYFAHVADVMYREALVPGQHVVFQAADAPRGPRAVGVQRIEAAPRPPDTCGCVYTVTVGGQPIDYACERARGHRGRCRAGGIELGPAPARALDHQEAT